MNKREKKYLGVGSPIVDILAQVDDDFIQSISGEKGGMELVTGDEMKGIIDRLEVHTVRACGGSVGNTTFAVARLGADAAFLGQLGNDADGEYYAKAFLAEGGDDSKFKFCDEVYTARCLSMVTPDSERTMRTDLGAAALLSPDSIVAEDFTDIDFVNVEGYLLFNFALTEKVLRTAKGAGCEVSLDLGSFEVVTAAGKELEGLLAQYVDYVFANEDEARAFTGSDDPLVALEKLGGLCSVAIVKLGSAGAWYCHNQGEAQFIPPFTAPKVLDTTGAGDYFAAGFIWGILQGLPLAESGRIGSRLGSEVVQHIGAELPAKVWDDILQELG